ncbi:hypothetical protein GCM10027447_25740 [Glycomyces halotolerans]
MSTSPSEALRHDPDFEWPHELWGAAGRPVLVLNDPAHDRSAWWPITARLADEHTVVILEPPEGPPSSVAEALARFTSRLGTRAPVLVGYSSTALIAATFALRYVAHAAVCVEQSLDTRPGAGEDDDPEALALKREITGGREAIRCPFLSVFATPQRRGYAEWLAQRIPRSRCEVYGSAGAFPHLADTKRFIDDVRSMAD